MFLNDTSDTGNLLIQRGMQNIKIISFMESNKRLCIATEKTLRDFTCEDSIHESSDKQLYVLAGPNGSGKSTAVSNLMNQTNIIPNYYICPDNFVKENIRDEQVYIEAMKKAEYLRCQGIKRGFSFIMETVLSSVGKLDFFLFAKENGYRITVIYVLTSDPAINQFRVKRRVLQGGHDVPPQKIIARYERCLRIMPQMIEIADSALIYDNSFEMNIPQKILCKADSSSVTLSNEYLSADWFWRAFRKG